MTDIKLKWQNPPTNKRGRPNQWDAVREQLKTRPGKWALVATNASTSMTGNHKRPGFEFVSRGKPEYKTGYGDIYARYVGDPEA